MLGEEKFCRRLDMQLMKLFNELAVEKMRSGSIETGWETE